MGKKRFKFLIQKTNPTQFYLEPKRKKSIYAKTLFEVYAGVERLKR